MSHGKGSGIWIAALCVLAPATVDARAQQSSPARESATGRPPSRLAQPSSYYLSPIRCFETFKKFPVVEDHPNAPVLVSGGLSQSRICQAPSVQPPGSQSAVPSGGRGESLTTPKLFVADILHDQARIWKFPWDVAHGRHWRPSLTFVVATAGLVELDPHDTPYFQRTQSFVGFNHTFSSLNTGLGEELFPVVFFLAGRARKDAYAEKSALLAGEALADAEILSEVMKNVDRRLRPIEIPPGGDFTHTWFKAGRGILFNRGSFPSGHAIGAFAVATVIAERYRDHRWVPWVAYGLAGLVGFSRISLQAHFPSDVFAGAVLGYAITRYDVLRSR
jgi:membrane-associated phospholipid phosphatase